MSDQTRNSAASAVPSPDDVPIRRTLGLTSATAIVIANMIGAGVFTTSGFSLASLGNREHVLLAWFVAGAIAISGAVGYGSLIRHMSESGGEYLFLSRTIHPLAGFLAGWISLVVGFTGAIAFAALAFCEYAIPEHPDAAKFLAIGVIAGFGLLHALGRNPGMWVQNAIVVLKVLVLLVLVGIAFVNYDNWPGISVANPPADEFAPGAFAATLVWNSLSYSGFNAAVYIAGEVKHAERTVPRGLILGTLIVTVFYLTLNAVFLFGPLPSAITGEAKIAMVAAPAVAGAATGIVLRLVICLALLSSVSSMVVAGPRVYAKMADDGVLPRLLAFRNGNASLAIALQCVLAIVFVWFSELESLLTYLGLVLSVSAALTVGCLFVLARRSQTVTTGPAQLAFSAFYVLATLFLAAMSVQYHIGQAADSDQWPVQLLAAGGTVVAGIAAYFVMSYFFARTGRGT